MQQLRINPVLPGVLSIPIAIAISLVFAFFVATGTWVFVAGILSLLGLIVAALYTPRVLVLALILGIPSVFVVIDGMLKARGIPGITAGRGLLLFIIGLGILRLMLGKVSLPKFSTLEKCMLSLIVVMLASLLSTASRKTGYEFYQGAVLLFEAYFMPFGAYLIARSMDWSDQQIRNLLTLLVCLGGYLFLVGSAQYFFGFLYLTPTYLGVGAETDRATGGFGSPVEFGMVMALMMLLSLLLYSLSEKGTGRALLVGLAACAAGGVALSLTRAQWLAAFIVLIFIFFKDRQIRSLLATGAALAGTAVLLLLPVIMQSNVLIYRVTDISPIYNRLALWTTAGNTLFHNPFFGVGFGFQTFHEFKREYLLTYGPSALIKYAAIPGVPHNEFLHILAMTGLVGASAYFLVYLNVWRTAKRYETGEQPFSPLRSKLALYLQAMLILFIISGMFAELWTFTYYTMLLFFFCGILCSRPRSDNG